jgi:hypothetical protein
VRIIIDLDESLTIGINIEGVDRPFPNQSRALRELAVTAGYFRDALLGKDDQS